MEDSVELKGEEAQLLLSAHSEKDAFSAYSPQLAQRLALSSTALNAIALAGNLGMYLSSPFVGRIIDRIGPTIPLLFASALLAMGYGSLWYTYIQREPKGLTGLLAALSLLLTGTGSSTALSASASAVARSFDSNVRATAIGVTLAGFGLSAFFWTTLSRLVTKGDTGDLLLVLAVGPALCVLVAAIGCRATGRDSDSMEIIGTDAAGHVDTDWRNSSEEESVQLLIHGVEQKSVSGWGLAKEPEFWTIWVIMGFCCGSTLMVINNIGTIVETLFRARLVARSVMDMRKHQARAVSVLSIFNCIGRVFAGGVSDILESKYGLRRVWWLTFISGLFLITQTIGFGLLDTLNGIPFLTGLVGFAYGNIYGTAPALVLEWFGLEHFASNFGFLNLAPMFSGQLFNLSFGLIYDHHRDQRRDDGHSSLVCIQGRRCYQTAFEITMLACSSAILLSIYLGVKKSRTGRLRSVIEDGNEEESTPILASSSQLE